MRNLTRRNFFEAAAVGAAALGMAGCGGSGSGSSSSSSTSSDNFDRIASQDMIDAGKNDGELVVYGSCEEEYLAAVTSHFEELFGIKTSYQRL